MYNNNSHELAKRLRIKTLDLIFNAKSSHIGSCYSIADVLAVMYTDFINYRFSDPNWPERDRFIVSKGHAAAIIYSLLSEIGMIPSEILDSYGKEGSLLMTHVSHKVPGVEVSTGSLGHGLPIGVGMALYAKKNNKNWKTVVLLSDGELDEGSNWEAILFAAHNRMNNLLMVIDYNKLQSLGRVEDTVGLEPLTTKLQSFNWDVMRVNGHDHTELAAAFKNIESSSSERPIALICDTIKGMGVSFMKDKVEWHYRPPNDAEYINAMKEISNA